MPRGIYDRSKVKKAAKTVSDVTEDAPKVKRKYTRKAEGAVLKTVTISDAPEAPPTALPGGFYELQELTRLAQGLAQLNSSGQAVLGPLVKKVTAAIEVRFDALYAKKEEEVVVEKPLISLPPPEKFTAATPTAPTA